MHSAPATTSTTSAGRARSRTRPTASPPVQVADLAAGSLGAVTEVLAALVQRARTGEGARIVVSMTHRSHDLVAHRLGGDTVPRQLTGGLACYRAYLTADGRHLTVAALEPVFFVRLCELLERPDLAQRQFDADQEALAAELAPIFASRPLADWLALFDDEDVCVGPVATRAEAHADLGPWPEAPEDVPLGAHTQPGVPARRSAASARRDRRARDRARPAARQASGSRRPTPGGRRSRSSSTACMPSARAPSMSSSAESPTMAASAGATSSAASAASKIERCGLT